MNQSNIVLRTAAWYGDERLELDIPSNWDTSVFLPTTPPPLTDEQIKKILERPVGQAPLRQLFNGKSHPVIMVDDLNRPTPAFRVMPFVLQHIREAGVRLEDVTIVMATGTHGAPEASALLKKVGKEAASSCRLLVHNCFRDVVRIGTTSFGTPVLVNKSVAESDVVVGIGGVYPNYTAGFGGGSKLALGVLGMRSIFHLHFSHANAGWGSARVENDFRKDLDEIAGMIGMTTTISLQIDADRDIVQMHCGDYRRYFPDAVDFCHRIFHVPSPSDADIIISNTYPNDPSLTFARIKGFVPFYHGKAAASRIAIASCPEGFGLHHIYPFVNKPRFHRQRNLLRRVSMMSPGEIVRTISGKVTHKLQRSPGVRPALPQWQNPVWLYRPGANTRPLPSEVDGIRLREEWSEIVREVNREQGNREGLKVVVYPCAFLQHLDGTN